jgi:hypothetical protein
MNYRRLITSLTLIAFLPLAIGCSTSTTSVVDLNSDPETSQPIAQLEDGEPLRISGYTRVSDGYRDFRGFVHLASPDSVQFLKDPDGSTFELSRADIVSVVAVLPKHLTRRQKEVAVTVSVFVVVVGAAAAVYAVQN